MFRCLIALTFLVSVAAVAAPAWTWVDAAGRRHFSDRPMPGATRIELPESRSAPRPPAQATAPAAEAAPAAQVAVPIAQPPAVVSYSRFEIANPLNEQTLWNIGGNLPIQVELEPSLQPGHHIDAVLDGQRMGLTARSPQITIPDVYRGLHTVQAIVVDTASGRELSRTQPVTIMVQQTSIQNPNR